MQCSKCGSPVAPGKKFCSHCGNPVMEAGKGYHEAPQRSFVPQPGAGGGNHKPTELETQHQPGGPQMFGGAAQATVPESDEPGWRPQGAGPVAGRTVMHEEVAKPLAGWLVIVRSREQGLLYRDIPVFVGQNRLGRNPMHGPHCIPDAAVSNDHAMVVARRDADGFHAQITDISSDKNHTAVNQKPIQTANLSEGDRVKIGGTTSVWVPLPSLRATK